MANIYKILVIDDDEVDRMSVCRALKKSGVKVNCVEAGSYQNAISFLEAENAFDCIFVDYNLPDKNGLDLVTDLRTSGNKLPLVVLTGQGDEQIAVELMKAGASDYLNKSRINSELLWKVLHNVIQMYQAQMQIEQYHEKLQQSNEELRRKNQELEEKREQIHQQNLKLLEAAELKSRFLATMSHELRTPLNAIIAFSQILLMKSKAKLTSKEVNMVDRIFNNGKNLLFLIDDILDISKIEAGSLSLNIEEFNLINFINTTVGELSSLAEKKKLDLNLIINVDNPKIKNDKIRLRQVLVNLLSNAIKFTESGQVGLEVKEISPEKLIISVSDTGIGIEKSQLDYIFEPFRQVNQTISRKYQGTGLGLAITNSLLKMMKGKIVVKSELGKGTTFLIEINRNLLKS
ncbi:MAG: ATP-binding protein, partial [Cyanobacteria bacterium P01_A01_bin.84]